MIKPNCNEIHLKMRKHDYLKMIKVEKLLETAMTTLNPQSSGAL